MTHIEAFRRLYNRDAAGQADAFGRNRVSNPTSLFDSQQQYDTSPLLWENDVSGSATITHDANEACADLNVTTASGDKAVRQTREYFRYQPLKSQLIAITFVLATSQENMRQRVGYFDGSNGIFFEVSSGIGSESAGDFLSFVRRTSTSGTVDDSDEVYQSSWNIDPLDGTGPSGKILDQDDAQILFIDLEWLGVGSVRVGFVIDGAICYAHQFTHANVIDSVYMTTANLPVRYEIENTDIVASTATMKAICCGVVSEGGFEANRGYPFSGGNDITSIAVTTRRPVYSIRPKATFNSIVNRGTILPFQAEAYATTNAALIEIVYGGTLTNASFSSHDASSIVEDDVSANAISGGITIARFPVIASGTGVNSRPGVSSRGLTSRLPLTLDISGANPKNLSVVATSFSGTSNVSGFLSWEELR